MKCYTWYVNLMGDVQVYEGNVLAKNRDFAEACSEEEAKNAHIDTIWEITGKAYTSIWGLLCDKYENEYSKVQKKVREPIRYWIPSEYSETFFTCINEERRNFCGSMGITYVDISKFLDD